MTAISTIYDSIANMTVTVGSVTPSVRKPSELRDVVQSADTPIRLLLVVAPDTQVRDAAFVAIGNLMRIDWSITDRLLWKPAAQGTGLIEVSDTLVDYIDAYIEAVRDNRATSAQSHITNVRFIPAIYYWPDQASGIAYYGVDAILTVEDIVSG